MIRESELKLKQRDEKIRTEMREEYAARERIRTGIK